MKNTVNAILENLAVNEARLNEVKSINLGNGTTAYQSNGTYYIKKGDERKEISSDQYQKLLNKNTDKSTNKSSTNKFNKSLSDEYITGNENDVWEYDANDNDKFLNTIFDESSELLKCNKSDITIIPGYLDSSAVGPGKSPFEDLINSSKKLSKTGISTLYETSDKNQFVINDDYGEMSLAFINK